jgi:nicotinamidase/pyrazinamidase
VQDTKGAQFHPVLTLPGSAIILSKGMSADGDSYSVFQAVDDQKTAFDALLRRRGITSLFIGGLATDYCVKWTVLDGLKLGYKTTLLLDAIKGVDVQPRDSEVAINDMVRLGAHSTTFERLYKSMAEAFKTVPKKGGCKS